MKHFSIIDFLITCEVVFQISALWFRCSVEAIWYWVKNILTFIPYKITLHLTRRDCEKRFNFLNRATVQLTLDLEARQKLSRFHGLAPTGYRPKAFFLRRRT